MAFPGGHVNYGEDTESACLRELKEECNLNGNIKKLIGAYGKPNRDLRKHVISIVYEITVENTNDLCASDDAADAKFLDIKDVIKSPENFAFDHYDILKEYIKNLDQKFLE